MRFRFGSLTPFFIAAVLLRPASLSAQGLIGYWKFDEGTGNVAQDATGQGNAGTISGAFWSNNGRSSSLLFDGINDQVDCGNNFVLSPTSAITVKLWLYPEVRPAGEKGVIVKNSISAYGVTFFQDGHCWWYVGGGGNGVRAYAPIAAWTQITCTYDSSETRIYANGELAHARSVSGAIPSTTGRLHIGNRPETGQRFRGFIDEVQIYNRALSPEEVLAAYVAEAPLVLANRPQVVSGPSFNGPGFTVRVGSKGGTQIDIGADRYFIDSSFSFPGSAIGLNYLSQESFNNGSGWAPSAVPDGPGRIRVNAAGSYYSIARIIELDGSRLEIRDTLTNTSAQDVGILINNMVIGRGGLQTPIQPEAGSASVENPTALLIRPASSLGTVVEDDFGRVHFERLAVQNEASFGSRFFALQAGASYTFEWAVYPSATPLTYPEFVKQIRQDWNANFPIDGPIAFVDVNSSPALGSVATMRDYLSWKRIKLALFMPWLDYDPGSLSYVPTRQQYKDMMLPAIATLRQADPDVLVLGCIETDWVTIYPDQIPGGNGLPQHGGGTTGQVELTPAQTAIIDNANLPWRDSYKRTAAGNVVLELYGRGGAPQTAISVYPEVGNYQHTFLMNQIQFLLDEVGMDGYYIDEFSQAWSGPLRTYNTRFNGTTWDGHSVDLDHSTGQIVNRWTDTSSNGIQSRVDLVQYALGRGKVVVANTNASSRAEQSLPVYRFNETFGHFDPMSWPLGTMPPLVPYLRRGHLNTPIAYGIMPQHTPPVEDYAQRLIKGLLMYLRHGLVYCHGVLPDPPRTGGGSGEFGPVNHMFPITPTAFGEGWIQGPERILTAVSRTFDWPQSRRPVVLLFNEVGKPVSHNMSVSPAGLGWTVNVQLADWAQIAVVHVDPSIAPADFDSSGEVDGVDLAHFVECITGAMGGPPIEGCGDSDLDLDGDTDQSDFGIFQRCISGSFEPADPHCAD